MDSTSNLAGSGSMSFLWSPLPSGPAPTVDPSSQKEKMMAIIWITLLVVIAILVGAAILCYCRMEKRVKEKKKQSLAREEEKRRERESAYRLMEQQQQPQASAENAEDSPYVAGHAPAAAHSRRLRLCEPAVASSVAALRIQRFRTERLRREELNLWVHQATTSVYLDGNVSPAELRTRANDRMAEIESENVTVVLDDHSCGPHHCGDGFDKNDNIDDNDDPPTDTHLPSDLPVAVEMVDMMEGSSFDLELMSEENYFPRESPPMANINSANILSSGDNNSLSSKPRSLDSSRCNSAKVSCNSAASILSSLKYHHRISAGEKKKPAGRLLSPDSTPSEQRVCSFPNAEDEEGVAQFSF